jgi:hypothetical protein
MATCRAISATGNSVSDNKFRASALRRSMIHSCTVRPARRMKDNPHAAGSLGDALPRLLNNAGFDCAAIGTRRNRFIGQMTFCRADRPDQSYIGFWRR